MKRGVRAAFVACLGLVLTGLAGGIALRPAEAADESRVTKTVDASPFAGLEVTVAKTASLVNEIVEVTWKNAKPTEPVGGYRRHFLQLMQCWGDVGPSPEQCQYGASGAFDILPNSGAVTSRRLTAGGLPVDPLETRTQVSVPFRAVDGREVEGEFDKFSNLFDAYTSNEIVATPTRADGTGREYFEMQTAAEAPGLGCGRLVSAPEEQKVGRHCWLVVVPRSDVEVDGKVRADETGATEAEKRLVSSPLSASNWKHRIEFRLDFQPIGGSCPLGVGQTQLQGQENATEVITRWQQSLCEATGAVFDFIQLPDTAARGSVAGASPRMAIVSRPLEGKAAKGDPVYAPLAISGVGFAYNLDLRVPRDAPPEAQQRNGQRVDDLKLTPRLVVKLLSQSYKLGMTVVPDGLENNPDRMEDDPDFLKLNPGMRDVNVRGNSLVTVMTPLNPNDATRLLWQWIGADADAVAFLSGAPDPDGMVVNPAWKDPELVRDDIPKLDQTCRPASEHTGPLCVPDAFPYSNDMHDGVRSANRGFTQAKTDWNQLGNPPAFRRSDRPQERGSRAIMVFADSATAARYNLPMARLKNANGEFVAPGTDNLLAAVEGMKESATPGVLALDPTIPGDAVYPLTLISYAATVPAGIDADARAKYAGLLEYAAGPGQQVGAVAGSLPAGYAPLPPALLEATKAAAKTIRDYAPPTPIPAPGETPAPTPPPTQQASGNSSASGGESSSASNQGTTTAGPGASSTTTDGTAADEQAGATAAPEPSAQPSPAPTPALNTPSGLAKAAITTLTPELPIGKARYALLWLFVAATIAMGAAQAAPRLPALRALGNADAPARTDASRSRPQISTPSGVASRKAVGGDAGAA